MIFLICIKTLKNFGGNGNDKEGRGTNMCLNACF